MESSSAIICWDLPTKDLFCLEEKKDPLSLKRKFLLPPDKMIRCFPDLEIQLFRWGH